MDRSENLRHWFLLRHLDAAWKQVKIAQSRKTLHKFNLFKMIATRENLLFTKKSMSVKYAKKPQGTEAILKKKKRYTFFHADGERKFGFYSVFKLPAWRQLRCTSWTDWGDSPRRRTHCPSVHRTRRSMTLPLNCSSLKTWKKKTATVTKQVSNTISNILIHSLDG